MEENAQMIEYKKWRKMLISGMIFAFVTMILGEIPIGWVKYPETGNELFRRFAERNILLFTKETIINLLTK